MCLAVYVASPNPLPIVPWDPESPAFHVIDLPPKAAAVRKHFNQPHVYYIGSQQGCSCAFNYEHEYRAILRLRDYLQSALTATEELELFVCQVGREDRAIQHSLIISPDGIALPEFFFKDGQFLLVCSAKSLRARREAEFERAPHDRRVTATEISR